MTPAELLGLPKPIEELTDEELAYHLAKYFPYSRPRNPRNYLLEKGEDTMKAMGTVTGKPGATPLPTLSSTFQDSLAKAMAAQGLAPNGQPLKPKKMISTR